MSQFPIIAPATSGKVPAQSGSMALVPLEGIKAPPSRELVPTDGFRPRQSGGEARRSYERASQTIVLEPDRASGFNARSLQPFAGLTAQFLSQPDAGAQARPDGYRLEMTLGTEAYRRAGAEPSLLSERPQVLNFSV